MTGTNGISVLPISLQTLLQTTEYPPQHTNLMQSATTKVAMIVDAVSPTPFALLRRAKHFEYRDDDEALQRFSNYDDPVQVLTDECRRVLKSISSTNDSMVSSSKISTGLRDTSWSRFEDVGFSGLGDEFDHEDEVDGSALGKKEPKLQGLRSTPFSKNNLGRPTTPSWADFLSSGFVDESGAQAPSPLLLPPDKILPPINTRGHSSQSHRRLPAGDPELEPGELASITNFSLDDAFWWVWITSLAGEEPTERKAVFGRCALIETKIRGGKWLVMEEIVKGAAPEPEAGAYIAEKKSRFGFSKRTRLTRSKSSAKKPSNLSKVDPYQRSNMTSPTSKTSIAPDQHARIQAAAAALSQKNQLQETELASPRRARHEDAVSTKTNSVFTLQPVIMSEAAPAMKWANSYDKNTVRAAYLGNNFAGRGSTTDLLNPNGVSYDRATSTNGSITPMAGPKTEIPRAESYGFPTQEPEGPKEATARATDQERSLPALPHEHNAAPAPESSLVAEQSSTPDTPPLPVVPSVNMQAGKEDAAQATTVPLPATTPMEYPRPMERKAVPSMNPEQANTRTREQQPMTSVPEHPQQIESNGYGATDSSPESQKPTATKLKKKGGGGGGGSGFKSLFGKKKQETPAPQSPSNTQAIAAARAALLQKAQQNQSQSAVPQQVKVSRRVSTIGRKKPANFIPIVTPNDQVPNHNFVDEHPASTAELTPVPSPRYPPRDDFSDSQASLSRVDTNEQQHAEREFRAFDQGPLEDQPAFVPEDSPSRISSDLNGSVGNNHGKEGAEHEPADDERESVDDASEDTNNLKRQISPVQDRWAQIRKNAAERAARQSEEQSRQTDRTDDGETSGEESKCCLRIKFLVP